MELNIAIHPLPKGRGLLAKEDKIIEIMQTINNGGYLYQMV
jgi:hypothetical protein